MTYKLKDHVTDEMLVAVGFYPKPDDFMYRYNNETKTEKRYTRIRPFYKEVVIEVYNKIHCDTKLKYTIGKRERDYIQDIIDLGYVEEMN